LDRLHLLEPVVRGPVAMSRRWSLRGRSCYAESVARTVASPNIPRSQPLY
jgi:hypothetical protein